MSDNVTTSAGMYDLLSESRAPFLRRGRDASKLTIPTILPDESSDGSQNLPTPQQSIGARGVSNLSASLLLALLPPNQSFFRLIPDKAAMAEQEEGVAQAIDAKMSEIETAGLREVELRSFRPATFTTMKQLIVTGNSLFYLPTEGSPKAYRMDKYVLKRDPSGLPLRIIIKEMVSPEILPVDIKAELPADGERKSVPLYTDIRYVDGMYLVRQEALGKLVEGSEGSYKPEDLPWIPLRLNVDEGEDWGRGYVEQYIGDLRSLEGLTKAIVEGSAASAKVLFMVDPNSAAGTKKNEIAQSPNGAIINGRADDVSVLQVQKSGDFSVAFQTLKTIEERLSYAFLLTESTIRRAERVTAAEVRLVTQSLERQLGGVYSVLSNEFQLPMVRMLLKQMTKAKKLPELPEDLIQPAIVTGIDALGRGSDLDKIREFTASVQELLGPQAVATYINPSGLLSRMAAAMSLESEGVVRSPEEIQQIQQQEQQAAQQQAAIGPAITAAAGALQNAGPTTDSADIQ